MIRFKAITQFMAYIIEFKIVPYELKYFELYLSYIDIDLDSLKAWAQIALDSPGPGLPTQIPKEYLE